MNRLKKLALAATLLIGGAAAALAAGVFSNYPGVGVTANTNCTSYGNNNFCNQYQPAGPSFLTGTEAFPADTNYVNPQGNTIQPYTITIPTSLFGSGYGNAAVSSATGTVALVQVADGVGTQIYSGAGTATYTSFKLPANPMNNQKLCLVNAGSGILTLTAVAAGTNSFNNTPTIVGVTPTSIPVATAVGTAGTVTLASNCWLYQSGANNTGIWYRVQ